MPPPAPFDRLARSDAFEELCYDLLDAERFLDLVWRGPGPDGGRDIEARWMITDPAGGTFWTRWYAESKWYSDSVPFSEIEPKLLAAHAARADVLLIMTSSRVMNTAIDSVDEWLRKRGRSFQVRYWVGRDLIALLARHPHVYAKHFGGTAPAWGDAIAYAAELARIADASEERLSRRLVPILQSAEGAMANVSPRAPAVDVAHAELELAAHLISCQGAVSGASGVHLAKREFELVAAVTFAIERAKSRVPGTVNLNSPPTLMAKGPRAVAVTAAFEALLNALMYRSDSGTPVEVRIEDEGVRWSMEVENASAEVLPAMFPVMSYRGQSARNGPHAGQGLGCWVAQRATQSQGMDVRWTNGAGTWVFRAMGAK